MPAIYRKDDTPLLRASSTRRSIVGGLLALLAPAGASAATSAPSTTVAPDLTTMPTPDPRNLDEPAFADLGQLIAPPTEPVPPPTAPSLFTLLDDCPIELHSRDDVIGFLAEELVMHLGGRDMDWPWRQAQIEMDTALLATIDMVRDGRIDGDATRGMSSLASKLDEVSTLSEFIGIQAIWAGAAIGFALGVTQPRDVPEMHDWLARALAVTTTRPAPDLPTRIPIDERVDAGDQAA